MLHLGLVIAAFVLVLVEIVQARGNVSLTTWAVACLCAASLTGLL